MTVGIDGGFVRAAHKEGFFDVIAGKSVTRLQMKRCACEQSSKVAQNFPLRAGLNSNRKRCL
jgi:hypothetical protein